MSSIAAASQPPIVVIGSLNADLVQRVSRLPRPGETITGSELVIVPGGKGANQAYAAARLGGDVHMIGQVGEDAFGPALIHHLAAAGVDTSGIQNCSTATGTAVILVLPNGENVIIIAPGANGKLSPDLATDRLAVIERGSIVLLQLEIPLETIEVCLATARERGAITILDPAPAQVLSPTLLAMVDYLTPNQTEAAFLLKAEREASSPQEAEDAARKLLLQGPSNVILKLGELGVVIADTAACAHVPGFSVKAVDSTAAGDTFNGALAFALSHNTPLLEAARFANAAAAISVTRHGAQSSIPDLSEVRSLLAGSHNPS
ncbi:MAG TPA: ribokinase [Bryobacteraceae bacterium]|nr:ribokinase [Bryobacteraceae bacterium]